MFFYWRKVATSKKPSHFTLWACKYLYSTYKGVPYLGPGSLLIGFLHLLITLRIFSPHQHFLTYHSNMTKPILSHFSEFWLGREIILLTLKHKLLLKKSWLTFCDEDSWVLLAENSNDFFCNLLACSAMMSSRGRSPFTCNERLLKALTSWSRSNNRFVK